MELRAMHSAPVWFLSMVRTILVSGISRY